MHVHVNYEISATEAKKLIGTNIISYIITYQVDNKLKLNPSIEYSRVLLTQILVKFQYL